MCGGAGLSAADAPVVRPLHFVRSRGRVDALRITVVTILAAGIGLLVRAITTWNSTRPGFTVFANYPSPMAAREALQILHHHGVRAELEDRRSRVEYDVWHGSVMVLVPTEQMELAERAFSSLKRV
jgi:hypothetical protein